MIQNILEPKDMLLKLIREGNRIMFEENPENLTDHFFNFSVTAHSIRDWCIKFQSPRLSKQKLNREWDKKPFLAIAKDIANSVKHFGIDYYTPKLKGSEAQTAGFIDISSAEEIAKLLSDQDYRESQSRPRPSYLVLFEDGEECSLNSYVQETVVFWLRYFDQYEIPREQAVDDKNLYIHRLKW